MHDGAAVDWLYGGSGLDWFLYTALGSLKDSLFNLAAGEKATAF